MLMDIFLKNLVDHPAVGQVQLLKLIITDELKKMQMS